MFFFFFFLLFLEATSTYEKHWPILEWYLNTIAYVVCLA